MSTGALPVVDQVLELARGKGLDQGALARAAGVAPETISRAKKRGNIELRTLNALAAAAGLEVRAQPVTGRSPKAPRRSRSSLAEPKWGLAWSNPGMDAAALSTNALLKGSYAVILEAALTYGIEFVRQQWGVLKDAPTTKVSKRHTASVERILRNIAKGFARAHA